MERDDEVKGAGNSYTTEFRQYDPRISRWLSLDPLMAEFPHQSPYVAFDDNPIYYNDPKGTASEDPNKEKGSEESSNEANDSKSELSTEAIGNEIDKLTNMSNSPGLMGDEVNASGTASANMKIPIPLYKDKLKQIAREFDWCYPCTDGEVGNFFEQRVVYNGLLGGFLVGTHQISNIEPNIKKFTDGLDRNTVPDFVGDVHIWDIRLTGKSIFSPPQIVKGAGWFEVKASYNNLYRSSYMYQIQGHIKNLANTPNVKLTQKKYPGFQPSLTIITTADVKVSQTVWATANAYNVKLYHYTISYTPEEGGGYSFYFNFVKSNAP